MSQEQIYVRILSPQKMLFSAPALSVSSKNQQGNFDILPQHANFISMIENQPIVVRQANKPPVTFKFPLAIIYVTGGKVNIYTNIKTTSR